MKEAPVPLAGSGALCFSARSSDTKRSAADVDGLEEAAAVRTVDPHLAPAVDIDRANDDVRLVPVIVMMMALPAMRCGGRGVGERRDADGGDSGEGDCSDAKHVRSPVSDA